MNRAGNGGKTATGIEKLSLCCDRALHYGVVVCSVFMVLTAGAQILCRVFLNLPLSWSEETATYLFIWWVYLGAALAVRSQGHLGIDVFVRRLPAGLFRVNAFLLYLLMLVFALLLAGYGFQLARSTMGDLTPITQIPLGLVFLIQPICGLSMAVFIVELILGERRPR